MSFEFQVESNLSSKELNHRSVSLVIPRISREKIHSMLYYKANLSKSSLRGDTMLELIKIMIRDLGTLQSQSINTVHLIGSVEFKCILMKLIEIKPTLQQILFILNTATNLINAKFNDKYIVALILTYIRIQYFFLSKDDPMVPHFIQIFKKYLLDYRKLKSVDLNMDCWSPSYTVEIGIVHMDELVDHLVKEKQIWGIPLGSCQWCNIFDDDESDSDSDSDSDDSDDSDDESN